MFKNNKIKKLLAFSVVSASFFLCGTSVSGAVKRSQSFGGFGSSKPQPSMRRASSLSALGGKNSKTTEKIKPFTYSDVPGGLKEIYKPIMIFSGRNPELVFEGRSTSGGSFRINPNMMNSIVYSYTKFLNTGENTKQFKQIIRE